MTFIPVAEATGLIVPIGAWMLREACRQAASWTGPTARDRPLSLNVNLSGRHFQQTDLAGLVAEALDETGLEPARLKLEITETTLAALQQLKALGGEVAIDDFGTGYSSLAHLKQFPVGVLKIDRAIGRLNQRQAWTSNDRERLRG